MHALVRKSNFSKAQGLHKTGSGGGGRWGGGVWAGGVCIEMHEGPTYRTIHESRHFHWLFPVSSDSTANKSFLYGRLLYRTVLNLSATTPWAMEAVLLTAQRRKLGHPVDIKI